MSGELNSKTFSSPIISLSADVDQNRIHFRQITVVISSLPFHLC